MGSCRGEKKCSFAISGPKPHVETAESELRNASTKRFLADVAEVLEKKEQVQAIDPVREISKSYGAEHSSFTLS